MGLDVATLFGANAIVLLVMAGAFFAASMKQQGESYWTSWIIANVALASALLLFMFLPAAPSWGSGLAHALLVLGFGFRWRAARQFTYHRSGWLPILAPVSATCILFVDSKLFSAGTVFWAINTILAMQAAAVALHFWRVRERLIPSSYGLAFAYALMAISFAIRAGQGVAFLDQFSSYLPHDWLLQFHLLVAVVHTSSSGAFALSFAYERAASHLRHERIRVEAEARKLGQLAERDALTGLMNRRAVERHYSELRCSGFDTAAVLDLDHFKTINDIHGHATGDAVLRAVAQALAPDADCLAVRLGGEEFMLLLRGSRARQRAEQRRRTIPTRVAAEVKLGRLVTASMGLLELEGGGASPVSFEELYSAADRLLYEAKRGGRNRTASEKITLFGRCPGAVERAELEQSAA